MAYHDTLFQLGMDLTRSSTAQKEDHGDVAQVARIVGSRTTSSVAGIKHSDERTRARYDGNHLLIDVLGVKGGLDAGHVEDTLKRCAEAAGATLQHIHLHQATPDRGVSGVAVLAEGYISVHCRPNTRFVAFDVLMSGATKPGECVGVLREAFSAKGVTVTPFVRGGTGSAAVGATAGSKLRPTKSKVRKAA